MFDTTKVMKIPEPSVTAAASNEPPGTEAKPMNVFGTGSGTLKNAAVFGAREIGPRR